jgi:hypothetical protein
MLIKFRYLNDKKKKKKIKSRGMHCHEIYVLSKSDPSLYYIYISSVQQLAGCEKFYSSCIQSIKQIMW